MFIFFFFNDTATTEIYTLSLHDALPISCARRWPPTSRWPSTISATSRPACARRRARSARSTRSEEHTSELQSPDHLVCRLLLEKKKQQTITERISVILLTDAILLKPAVL